MKLVPTPAQPPAAADNRGPVWTPERRRRRRAAKRLPKPKFPKQKSERVSYELPLRLIGQLVSMMDTRGSKSRTAARPGGISHLVDSHPRKVLSAVRAALVDDRRRFGVDPVPIVAVEGPAAGVVLVADHGQVVPLQRAPTTEVKLPRARRIEVRLRRDHAPG